VQVAEFLVIATLGLPVVAAARQMSAYRGFTEKIDAANFTSYSKSAGWETLQEAGGNRTKTLKIDCCAGLRMGC
jgi:hypothetical protein